MNQLDQPESCEISSCHNSRGALDRHQGAAVKSIAAYKVNCGLQHGIWSAAITIRKSFAEFPCAGPSAKSIPAPNYVAVPLTEIMPPPHLHPRSRMTSSLFVSTVVASFFVVALPHVLPCPAPRVAFADGEMPEGSGKRRRRRKPEITETRDGVAQFGSNSGDEELRHSARIRTRRECPVPKPGGVVGELLNLKKTKEGDNQTPADSS